MSQITDLVRERVGIIVARGLDSYGYFPVDQEKEKFYKVAVDLLLTVTSRIEQKESISIFPLKSQLLVGIFALNLDQELAINLFELVTSSLYKEIEDSEINDPNTLLEYKKYDQLLRESISDFDFLLKREPSEYLLGVREYFTSETIVNLGPTKSKLLKINRVDGKIGPPKSRLRSKFASLLNDSVIEYGNIIAEASMDINAIISDSSVNSQLPDVDESLLTATFSGEGSKIYKDIVNLYNLSMEFGGYDGSSVESVSYQTKYQENLLAMCYGRRISGGSIGESFGVFADLYQKNTTDTSISGLNFLEPFSYTRSFNQYTTAVNPVVKKFSKGLIDRYVKPPESEKTLDFVSLTLESLSVLCLKIGDSIQSLLNSPPKKIGNTVVHFEALSKIFPQSIDARVRFIGFTGAVQSLLKSHSAFYKLLGSEPDLQDFNVKLNYLSNLIESLTQTMRGAGFKSGGFVPSLELTFYEPDKDRIKEKLISIGFERSQVQEILSVKTFEELLSKFAPISDSQDVISFFRAYDLTKLLYEFGGQPAIDQYVNFLYGVDEETSLLNLLNYLKKDRSKASKFSSNNYSKLVGYIVSLTYAVNPENLTVLDSILKYNNLDLFESVTRLVSEGLPSALKDKDSIDLLSGTVAQIVVQDNSGYDYQKPLWNSLIEKSSGQAGASLSGLYDRAEGITPSELYRDLKKPSYSSPLGTILDGVRGGRLTTLLRYCNVLGLLYAMSPYRNSGQLINESADQFVVLLDVIDYLEELSKLLKIVNAVFEEYSSGDNRPSVYSIPLVKVQNKDVNALIDLIKTNNSTINLEDYPISESPGIGNARIPNGVRLDNSLSPEEASIISNIGGTAGIFSKKNSRPIESGSYIRIAVSNLLANGVQVVGTSIAESNSTSVEEPIKDYIYTYEPKITPLSEQNLSTFNPIESCKKFGGTDCDKQGYTPELSCSKGFNKSILPETGYGQTPPSPSGVPIDRPLGAKLSSNIQYPPVSSGHPQKFFSRDGIYESSRSRNFRNTELSCASLKNAYEYSACMSLLKCTKFKPPYEGKYSFKFCPSNLNGGKLNSLP